MAHTDIATLRKYGVFEGISCTLSGPMPQPPLTDGLSYDGSEGFTISLESFGVRIGIRLDSRCDPTGCIAVLPPGWVPVEWHDLDRIYRIEHVEADASPTGGAGFRVVTESALPPPSFAPFDQAAVFESLESAMHHYIAEFSTRHLFVHAGVVGWHDAAIVLPGRSFAGKTTLVTGLVRSGATYYSDEYAVLDEYGQVHAFPRRVKLRDGPFGPAGRYDIGQELAVPLPPLPVRLVAVLTYREQQGWDVEALDGAAAIMAVCDNTVAIRRRPADSFAMIGAMLSNADVIKGTRGTVDDAVSQLLDLCDRASESS